MNSKYLLLTLFFFSELLFCLNKLPYPELEIDKPQQFKKEDMDKDSTLFVVSKNSITGIFAYDIDSPVPLDLGYAPSDTKTSLPTSFDSHHNENITQWKTSQGYNYFFSFPVSMSNDGKYTFVKIACSNSSICIEGDAHINVKLVAEYTWKISIFVAFLYLIVIGAIISICFFGRKCLNICCNFTDKKIEQQLDLVE